jgi:hypothetical protein
MESQDVNPQLWSLATLLVVFFINESTDLLTQGWQFSYVYIRVYIYMLYIYLFQCYYVSYHTLDELFDRFHTYFKHIYFWWYFTIWHYMHIYILYALHNFITFAHNINNGRTYWTDNVVSKRLWMYWL